MAFYLKSLLWLGVLGGALAGIGLPTNNAVQSILNKSKIRQNGWNTQAGLAYEDYWYGAKGFGDDRNETVSDGQWTNKIKTALSDIRNQWGKQKLGEGLEKKFEGWLKTEKLCDGSVTQASTGSGSQCSVGKLEFIEEKDKSLFGRIPLKDKDGKKVNVYIRWYKCTQNPQKGSGIWFGGSRKENGAEKTSKNSIQNQSKYSWCFTSTESTK
ncbi:hypothetical protein [Candidatus Mycoplasma haematominutum]|uniref:Uncharacterized protein n=1 Tax=Candidatus Mycoplasma haematominutum 'Birmingham 1' TaxID=1116213 RepID=G8C2R9_9MOLU|nr:hypothetical protein [Candidatus Mycoplasma haematominutum]CCE66617.1 hypothetical protein MHM_00990 [Candidatus Mycoplasma haematominutum 'Birmingham 1']